MGLRQPHIEGPSFSSAFHSEKTHFSSENGCKELASVFAVDAVSSCFPTSEHQPILRVAAESQRDRSSRYH